MSGAPVLAAKAALFSGAGLCYAIYLKNPPAYDPVSPEIMFRAAHQFDFATDVIVTGPGLGKSGAARDIVIKTIEAHTPIVLDADALNILSENGAIAQMLSERDSPTIITPHPLEAARLLKTGDSRLSPFSRDREPSSPHRTAKRSSTRPATRHWQQQEQGTFFPELPVHRSRRAGLHGKPPSLPSGCMARPPIHWLFAVTDQLERWQVNWLLKSACT